MIAIQLTVWTFIRNRRTVVGSTVLRVPYLIVVLISVALSRLLLISKQIQLKMPIEREYTDSDSSLTTIDSFADPVQEARTPICAHFPARIRRQRFSDTSTAEYG